MGSKLKAFWDKLKQQAVDIWDKDKGLFFLVAVAALVVKFRDILLDILISGAKREETAAKKKDQTLASQENDLKAQADDMVKKAQEEPSNQKPVTDDWYKNS
jgi:hypothetical protein